jgi:signal peptidase I
MQVLSQKSSLKKLVKNHGRKLLNVLVLLAVIAIGFLSFWFVLKAILNTEYPILPVSSSNMCVFQSNCDGLARSFEPTLHVGDLVIVQGVNCSTVRVAYPKSDILVFHFPKSDSSDTGGLVITRVVAKEERNGMIYFRTKGDGVGVHTWPEIPSASECDRWYDYRENYTWNDMISEKLLVDKVVFRIPWIGYIALFVQNPSGILVIVVLIIIILIAEFAIPTSASKKAKAEPERNVKTPLKPKAL